MCSRSFEDVQIGDKIGPLVKGPMSPAHIMRWSAAVENWHRIHYDYRFATNHDGLPDVLVNGSWKQHVIVQLMTDWLGVDGWLWRVKFRYKAMDVAWNTIIAEGEVREKNRSKDYGLVTCRVALTNQNGNETTSGWATGVLPLREGPPVPYPFRSIDTLQDIRIPSEHGQAISRLPKYRQSDSSCP